MRYEVLEPDSMTRSCSPKPAKLSTGKMRAMAATRASSVTLPDLTCRLMLPLIVDRKKSGQSAYVGNARAHLAGADDADFPDFHLGFLAQSIQTWVKA